MAAAATPARRSARATRPPLTLAEEQALSALSHEEQRDVAAALRLSLASSWESDDDDSEAGGDSDAPASSDSENEEQPAAADMEVEEEWSSDPHAIELPPPRLRHEHAAARYEDATALDLLQLFLPPSLMKEFAQHTNAAAPQDWSPTTAAELYAFLGVHSS
jgi:Transposase IS4